MRPAIRDVANKLKLSITTVSRALDGYDDVAEHTREIVIKTVRQMGYSPNRAARQLRHQKSDTVGYILPTGAQHFSEPFFTEFIAAWEIGFLRTTMTFWCLQSPVNLMNMKCIDAGRMVGRWMHHRINGYAARTISFGELPGGLGQRLVFVPSIVTNNGALHVTIPTLPSPDIATTGIISYTEVFPLSLRDPKGFEQALVVHIEGHGLVVITGCGHPTIERLVERAEALYGQPVVGVVGGFHYEGLTIDDVKPHIEFLRSHNPQLIAMSPHDSSTEALNAFAHALPAGISGTCVGDSHPIPFDRGG